jgi:uncharacterized repeat protein (TIGR04076 family)
MKIDERVWSLVQQRLGYSDEEIKTFREDPRNADVLSQAAVLSNKTIVVEVVESHGCNSQHKAGDKFYFDGAGNLLTSLGPKRICVHALSATAKLIFAAQELFYAGIDPNVMRFKRAGCIDVGLQCGGWGKVVLEIRMEERQ